MLNSALQDPNPRIAQHAASVFQNVYGVPPRPSNLTTMLWMLASPAILLFVLAAWACTRRRSRDLGAMARIEFDRAGNLGIGLGLFVLIVTAISTLIMSMTEVNPRAKWVMHAPMVVLLGIGVLGISVAVWGHRIKSGMVLDTVMFCILAGIVAFFSALSVLLSIVSPGMGTVRMIMLVCNALFAVMGGVSMFRILRAQWNLSRTNAR